MDSIQGVLAGIDGGKLSGVVDSFAMQKNFIGVPVIEGDKIYMDVEALGGGDSMYTVGTTRYTLDCTNGDGVGGKARIELLQGTSEIPQWQVVYAHWSETAQKVILSLSQFMAIGKTYGCMIVGYCSMKTFAEGDRCAALWQTNTDISSFENRGRLSYVGENLRLAKNNNRINGCEIRLEFTTNPAGRDNIDVKMNGGDLYQLHLQQANPFDSVIKGFPIIGQSESCAIRNCSIVQDLGSVTETADGNAIPHGKTILIDFFIIMNSNGLDTVAIMIGQDIWDSPTEANRFAKILPPRRLPQCIDQVGAYLGRAVLTYKSDASGTWSNAMFPETTTSYWKRVDVNIKTPSYPYYDHGVDEYFGGTTAIQGATRMRAHYNVFDTESGYDKVYQRDAYSSTNRRIYQGNRGSFISDPIDGNQIRFYLHTDGNVGRIGAWCDYIEGFVVETIGSVSGNIYDGR